MDYLPWIPPIVALTGLTVAVAAARRVVVVYDETFALHWRDGKFVGRLPSGKTTLWGARHRVRTIDKRLRHDTISGQEIMASDGAMVRVSLVAAYRVTDPEAHYNGTADPADGAVDRALVAAFWPSRSLAHEAAHTALRDAISKRTTEECLAQRAAIADEIASAVTADFSAAGLALERIVLKDLGVGGELRRAMGDLQVSLYQARANLERARAEGAVMRSLANSARVLEGNPALVQMRLLQAIESGRAQVIVGSEALKVVERRGEIPPMDAEV